MITRLQLFILPPVSATQVAASRFTDLPGPAGTTPAGCLTRVDATWAYVTNTESTPTTATLLFAAAPCS